MKLLDFRIARLCIALWMTFQAMSCFFDGCLLLSYKLRLLGITKFLGLRTEGDDYRRFIPLMNATPLWSSVLALFAGMLYIVVAIQVLGRRKSAFGLLIAALALSAGQWIHELNNPLFTEAFSFAHLTRDAMMYAVTALLAAVLVWQPDTRPVAKPAHRR
jgi:hypothetical protein